MNRDYAALQAAVKDGKAEALQKSETPQADAVAVELLADRAKDGCDGEADVPCGEVFDDTGEERRLRVLLPPPRSEAR